MYPLLQMGKSRFGDLTAKNFWSSPSQMYGAEEQGTGELEAKSCSAADLLSHLNWTSWASKECVWTAHKSWVKLKFHWSLSTSSSLQGNPPLFKSNQKSPNHMMYVTNTSAFSPSLWYSLNQHFWRGGKIFMQNSDHAITKELFMPIAKFERGWMPCGWICDTRTQARLIKGVRHVEINQHEQ